MPFSPLCHINQRICEFVTVFWPKSGRVASMQESLFPIADMPKVGINTLGTGSGAQVDVAWLS